MKNFVNVVFNKSSVNENRDIIVDAITSTGVIGLLEDSFEYEMYEGPDNTSVLSVPIVKELNEKQSNIFAKKLANKLFDKGHTDFDIEISVNETQLNEALLRRGSRGEEVRQLQIDLGMTGNEVDGIFGPNTEQTVRNFQQNSGAQVDGIVGPQTRALIANSQAAGVANRDEPYNPQEVPQTPTQQNRPPPRPRLRPQPKDSPRDGGNPGGTSPAAPEEPTFRGGMRNTEPRDTPRDGGNPGGTSPAAPAAQAPVQNPDGSASTGTAGPVAQQTPGNPVDDGGLGQRPAVQTPTVQNPDGSASTGTDGPVDPPREFDDTIDAYRADGLEDGEIIIINGIEAEVKDDNKSDQQFFVRPGTLDPFDQPRDDAPVGGYYRNTEPRDFPRDGGNPGGTSTAGPDISDTPPNVQTTAPSLGNPPAGQDSPDMPAATNDTPVNTDGPASLQQPSGPDSAPNIVDNPANRDAQNIAGQQKQWREKYNDATVGRDGLPNEYVQIVDAALDTLSSETAQKLADETDGAPGAVARTVLRDLENTYGPADELSSMAKDVASEDPDQAEALTILGDLMAILDETANPKNNESVSPRPKGAFMVKERAEWDAAYSSTHYTNGKIRPRTFITESKMQEVTFDDDDAFFEAYGVLWFNEDAVIDEAEYQGRKVKLGKPMQGDTKKFKVYVKNPKGNVVKVNFGQKGAKIKKNNPERRRSFRARHNCDNPGPRHKARYWSCRKW